MTSSGNEPGVAVPAPVLLAAGTASYDCPDFLPLDKVSASLQTVVTSLSELGYLTIAGPPGYQIDPELRDLRAAVRVAARAAPVVVVYYTGHGAHPERDTYYLVTRKSGVADLDESALPATDLPRLLTRRNEEGLEADQPTVLVILDCCYSGSGGIEILAEALRGIGNENTWVIASAGDLQYAQQGVFAAAFADALKRPKTGSSQRFLDLITVVDAINKARPARADQEARVFPPFDGATGIPPFLPNRHYRPGVAGLAVSEQHWLSRLRGGPEESTTGFYVTGRTGRIRASEELARWMTDPGRTGLGIVTGSPGTGKSAVLALLVFLSQPSGREDLLRTAGANELIRRTAELMPSGIAAISVYARGLTTDQSATFIAKGLDRSAGSASALLEDLDTTPEQGHRVVIVDAIDEATSPGTLLDSLLIPMASQHGIKVVIGARRHVLSRISQPDLKIDLDAENYRDPQALTDYIRQLLTASREPELTTPYQTGADFMSGEETETVATVAAAIAQRATARGGAESFLIARLLALSIRARPAVVDIAGDDWQTLLPASVGMAFDSDLARLGNKTSVARILLEALAWANGPGLPWENIWVPVARALADQQGAVDDDVRWLLERAGAYIVEDLGPGGRSVFRPFHDLLAAHLRGKPDTDSEGTDPGAADNWQQRLIQAQKAITQALLGTVPSGKAAGPRWPTAHPYLRAYLAQHAEAAGPDTFSALVHDADFLAVADPATLIPLLTPAGPAVRDIARAYRRASPLLGGKPSANAAYLQEAAFAVTGTAIGSGQTGIRPLYRTLLASVRPDDSLLTLTGHTHWVGAVAFGTAPDGSALLASGSRDCTVRLWDPASGTPVGPPLTGHADYVNAVAFGTDSDGRTLLATGSGDQTVQLWDLATGIPAGPPLTGHTGAVTSVAFGTGPDGRTLLATGSSDQTVRLWDLATGTAVGPALTGHTAEVNSVAFGTGPDGRTLLATGSRDNTVRLWDSVTGTPAGPPLTGHTGWVNSVAFGTGPDGRTLLATGSRDNTVRLWDSVTGTPAGPPLTGHTGWVNSVAFGTGPDGRTLLATGSSDQTVRLWDLATGTPAGPPLTGHTGFVDSVAFGTGPDGRTLLATGSSDYTVRLWDPVTGPGPPVTGHTGQVYSVAFGTGPDGRTLLASGSFDETVRLWDPARGTLAGPPLTGHTSGVRAVAFGTGPDGRALLASGGGYFDNTVRLWDLATGTPAAHPSPAIAAG